MTSVDFIERVKEKLKFNKIDFNGADKVLENYLPFSLQRLWNLYAWDEKRAIQSLAVASGEYSFNLSTNFDQITGIVFKGNEQLPPIRIVSESEFKAQFPNVAHDYSGVPSIASILYDSTTGKTVLTLAPKANGSYTLEIVGRRKVPDMSEVPDYLHSTLEKLLIEDITMPTSDAAAYISQAAQREGSAATNITPKAVSIKPTMESGIGRDGRHIFNFSEGCE